MRYLVGQRCGLRGDVCLSRADLDLFPARRASSSVQATLFDEADFNIARVGEVQKTAQHVRSTLSGRLRRQLRQWIAVSLADVEHVNDLEPESLCLLTSNIF